MKDKLISITPESVIRKFKKPTSAIIEVTNACNLNCPSCPTQIHKRKRGFMKLNDFIEIINKLPYSIKLLNFNWSGEPMLNSEIFKILGYTHNIGIRTHISTNATTIDKFRPAEISHSDMGMGKENSIAVCIDGPTKSIHESFRRGSDFRQIIRNAKLLRQSTNSKLILQSLLWKKNQNISRMVKLAKKLKADELHMRYFSLAGAEIMNLNHHKIADEFLPESQYSIYNEKYMLKEPMKKCTAFTDPVILWNGDMTTCCLDNDGHNIYANLLKESWKNAWSKNPIKKIAKKQTPICAKCRLSKHQTYYKWIYSTK